MLRPEPLLPLHSVSNILSVCSQQQNDNEKVDAQNLSNGHANTDQDAEQETAAKGARTQRRRRDLSAERELTVGIWQPIYRLSHS